MKTFIKRNQHLLVNITLCLLILAMAYLLKAHYSRGSSDDLAWILATTAALTERVTGIPFLYEEGAGYLSREHHVLIAPSCAGVNFLIIAFCMAAFCGIQRLERLSGKLFWITVCTVSACGLTISVNTLRIAASIHLYRADIYCGWITPERVHRIGGAALYFLALYLFYTGILWILRRMETRSGEGQSVTSPVALWPLFWYLAVTAGVPLLNAAWKNYPGRFAEHCLMVVSVSMGILLLTVPVQWGCKRLRERLHSIFQ